ncbi:MAG: hypothetical protein KME17_09850 [Cyanosarcina radialis HA8281-LM2]|jgi:hypothetical protein|nr:hypothetical protein [Cyanosarcina radialis HA8281-LM2]
MEQNALTVIVPIKDTEVEVEALTAILTEIGNNIEENQYVRFRDTPSTHFARWVILKDRGLGTDPKQPRLLFTSNYDGTFENYMKELVEKIGSGMESIWSKCVDYDPSTAKDPTLFGEFIQQHSVKANTFYVGIPGATVENILNGMETRTTIDRILDGLDRQEAKTWLDQLSKLLPRTTPTSSGTKWSPGEKIDRQPQLSLRARAIEWLVGVRPGKKNRHPVALKPDLIKQLAQIEDKSVLVQNQMTIVSPIRPQWFQRALLKWVLGEAQKRPQTKPGTLNGIATIHFARWVIIDNGENLLFESNYDGSWENYIDDFVDLASTGMNSIWGSAINFPTGGCRDIEGFKQIIRYYQVPTQVFYSAYPDLTVKNILNDLELSRAVTRFLTGAYNL